MSRLDGLPSLYVAVMVKLTETGCISVYTVGPFGTHIEAVEWGNKEREAGHCHYAGFDIMRSPTREVSE